MKRGAVSSGLRLAVSLIALLLFACAALSEDGATPTDGPSLAAQLTSAAPEENSEIHGVLHIRIGSLRTNVPINCVVEAGSNSWRTIYQTPADTLIVVHSPNAPNQYLASTNHGPTNALAAAEIDLPLAGSDFTLADLGLDFLHWQGQKLLKGEMRLGQSCWVLESSATNAPSPMVRIRSYIDRQSGGIILAEGYDSNGRLIKRFTLRGSFFRKVHGQWRLEKMEMEDRVRKSQTIIQFDLGNE